MNSIKWLPFLNWQVGTYQDINSSNFCKQKYFEINLKYGTTMGSLHLYSSWGTDKKGNLEHFWDQLDLNLDRQSIQNANILRARPLILIPPTRV